MWLDPAENLSRPREAEHRTVCQYSQRGIKIGDHSIMSHRTIVNSHVKHSAGKLERPHPGPADTIASAGSGLTASPASVMLAPDNLRALT
jgi:hypothetical protein